jgi:MFS family permease
MPVLRDLGKIVRVTVRGSRGVARGVRATAVGATATSRWVGRNVGSARQRGGRGNRGMMRLLDLHAVSCAGDTLVTIGLAGTIFFGVPTGEARGRVALYLLVTMVPFALLAPVVGPLLDRFRHGRRYALAATMLGRALLAWMIADNLVGFGLYPAAFGVLALSRAYGVARSAAVPRLLPPGMGLSQAGARASVYGTVAGTIVAPLGAIAFTLGPQWPLRVASIIFLIGVVVALNLPAKADSDPPEAVPKVFHLPWRHRAENGDRVLSGRLVVSTLIGSACLRATYGFLLLFMAFTVREQTLDGELLGIGLSAVWQLAFVGSALALGTFVATAIGTSLRIRRPTRLQAIGICLVALAALYATVHLTLVSVLLLCLSTAVASGLAKLAVDASIQERIPETVRASAFAHAETLLMLAWVVGGALGLIPVTGRLGVGVAALALLAAAVRSVLAGWRLRGELLRGRAMPPPPMPTAAPVPSAPPAPAPLAPTPIAEDDEVAPPGYHIFKPSSDVGISDPRGG